MAHTCTTAYTTHPVVRENGKEYHYETGWCLCGKMTYHRRV